MFFFCHYLCKKMFARVRKKCCEYGDVFIIFTSNYDIISHKMVPAAKSLNDVKIYVGASSADIKLTKE